MSRKRLWDLIATSLDKIVSRSNSSVNQLKANVTNKAISTQPQKQQLQSGKFSRLKDFWVKAVDQVISNNQRAVQESVNKLRLSVMEQKSQRNLVSNQMPAGMEGEAEDQDQDPPKSKDENPVGSHANPNNVEVDRAERSRQSNIEDPQLLEGSLPVVKREYSFQDKYKPTERLTRFLSEGIQSIVTRQTKVNNVVRELVRPTERSQLLHHQDHLIQPAEDPLHKNEQLRETANFPTSMEDVEAMASSVRLTDSVRHAKTISQSRISDQLANLPKHRADQFPQDPQEENQFVEYVEEQRMEKLKYDVQQLKKQHQLPTNYDASDEESMDPAKPPSYMSPLYKHKTEVSNDSISRIFEPRIYVIEAPGKNIVGSTADVRDNKWPATDPKKKKKHLERHAVSKSLVRTPVKIYNQSNDRDSFEYDLANYTEKILKLKEARRKKQELEEKLQLINKQITDIRNPEVALEEIRKSKSPKNSLKHMISISDDRQARNKALTLVRKLRHQRQKREKMVSNIFSKVDKEVMESIAQLNRVRQEQERQAKQRRKLQVLQRMRDQERRKLDEYRLLEEHGSFLQALQRHEERNKPVQSRRSMAWIRMDDTPELAARKELLEKLRNLSYVEKRSIMEEYNRQLLRK